MCKHIDIHRYVQDRLNWFDSVIQLERDKLDTFSGKNMDNLVWSKQQEYKADQEWAMHKPQTDEQIKTIRYLHFSVVKIANSELCDVNMKWIVWRNLTRWWITGMLATNCIEYNSTIYCTSAERTKFILPFYSEILIIQRVYMWIPSSQKCSWRRSVQLFQMCRNVMDPAVSEPIANGTIPSAVQK